MSDSMATMQITKFMYSHHLRQTGVGKYYVSPVGGWCMQEISVGTKSTSMTTKPKCVLFAFQGDPNNNNNASLADSVEH